MSFEAGSGCQVLEDCALDHPGFQAGRRLGQDGDYQRVQIANISRAVQCQQVAEKRAWALFRNQTAYMRRRSASIISVLSFDWDPGSGVGFSSTNRCIDV